MIKKAFIGLTNSWLNYERLPEPPPTPVEIPTPDRLTLVLEADYLNKNQARGLAVGTPVRKGDLLSLETAGDATAGSVVATAGGKIQAVRAAVGDFHHPRTEVVIDIDADRQAAEELAPDFSEAAASGDLQSSWRLLGQLPGRLPFERLLDPERPITTIVVNGIDPDLLVATAKYTVKTRLAAIQRGIERLKQLAPVEQIIMVVPRDEIQGYGHIGTRLFAVDSRYPAGHPHCIVRSVLEREVPAGKRCEDLGICFFSAEGVANLGDAAEGTQMPADKLITLIDKEGRRSMVSARIGTPIGVILDRLQIGLDTGDRIILGGPMTGSAVYSPEHPVGPGTDAILVQDRESVTYSSDYPCINCGECIRVCPADIPVNMLVRFLEAGQYEEAAEMYDLLSCIECGLCSFVCVSRIPVFQHITLAKYELQRIQAAEDSND